MNNHFADISNMVEERKMKTSKSIINELIETQQPRAITIAGHTMYTVSYIKTGRRLKSMIK